MIRDSQAAIPLATMTARRATHLYELMDASYDAPEIKAAARALGRVAIVRERTCAERVNGRLKDEFGGRCIRARGHAKVMCHLMFGVLVLAVDQLMRLLL